MVGQRLKKKSGAAGLRAKASKKSVVSTAAVGSSPGVASQKYPAAIPEDVPQGGHVQQEAKSKLKLRRREKVVVLPQNGGSGSEGAGKAAIAKELRRLHPADERRAALKKRRQQEAEGVVSSTSLLSASRERLEASKADILLYEKAANTAVFQNDPFAAIDEHLTATMDTLKPQTPDVGRAPR